MSQTILWTLLSFQPVDCRPVEFVSAYSGGFAPDFAPGLAPEVLKSGKRAYRLRVSTYKAKQRGW